MNHGATGTSPMSSKIVQQCQLCGAGELQSVLFLGYLPPVNEMHAIGTPAQEQPSYPAELLLCPHCELVQLGLVVSSEILFPPSYPYTSGTTRVLHRNFDDLAEESRRLWGLTKQDRILDIGANDGTLLSYFQKRGHPVLGIEPTDAGQLAQAKGIDTLRAFFNQESARQALERFGAPTLVSAANCFAHIDDIHAIVEGILTLLPDDGIFVNESHYLIPLIDRVQYDTIYHEHLRYYSLTSLSHLFDRHGLEVIHCKAIPSHGGSIRVYAARRGKRPIQSSVAEFMAMERARGPMYDQLMAFKSRVVDSKLKLYQLLTQAKAEGGRIVGISAPSRASTLTHYVGLDDTLLDAVLEIKGSRKIGKYMPGKRIPVLEEGILFEQQPEYALIFSWHIADELIPILRGKGYRGRFILPLPEPRLVS